MEVSSLFGTKLTLPNNDMRQPRPKTERAVWADPPLGFFDVFSRGGLNKEFNSVFENLLLYAIS
ncbi:MAG: hypothetical protein EBS85_02115 [Micrococcales bacterium]|nr:hypothetical protein [Actinomycetota bacterium]NCA07512.1 hypothetical protein [Micrococcales bacterium]